MRSGVNGGNGHSNASFDILDIPPPPEMRPWPPIPRRRKLWPAVVLFLLTVITTLAMGSEYAISYAQNREPFSSDQNLFAAMVAPFEHPHLLLLGIPFSFTLLAFFLAHEMGHFYACKYYGIDATYPYFMPGPPFFGTFGAVIRIRSPITTLRALFDIGIAGPIAGFLVAVPAMAFGIAHSKILPGVAENAPILFGNTPLMRIFIGLFHQGADPAWLLLHPVGRAAWVGLFATALNLLPLWQLDGGHILYSLTNRHQARISIALALGLLALGYFTWTGWYLWGGILLILSLRFPHPAPLDRWEQLDAGRKLFALVALAIFLLCFTPWPIAN
jgi:membrane-associated protease RseP (regulator of RpoE activity)